MTGLEDIGFDEEHDDEDQSGDEEDESELF